MSRYWSQLPERVTDEDFSYITSDDLEDVSPQDTHELRPSRQLENTKAYTSQRTNGSKLMRHNTISKDKTGGEDSQRSASLAYLGSKLTSHCGSGLKLKSIERNAWKRADIETQSAQPATSKDANLDEGADLSDSWTVSDIDEPTYDNGHLSTPGLNTGLVGSPRPIDAAALVSTQVFSPTEPYHTFVRSGIIKPLHNKYYVGEKPEEKKRRLQDYQMQLMLLEQQNKKRLLMARHDMDAGFAPKDDIEQQSFFAGLKGQSERAYIDGTD